jgi:hypothetical protein
MFLFQRNLGRGYFFVEKKSIFYILSLIISLIAKVRENRNFNHIKAKAWSSG